MSWDQRVFMGRLSRSRKVKGKRQLSSQLTAADVGVQRCPGSPCPNRSRASGMGEGGSRQNSTEPGKICPIESMDDSAAEHLTDRRDADGGPLRDEPMKRESI